MTAAFDVKLKKWMAARDLVSNSGRESQNDAHESFPCHREEEQRKGWNVALERGDADSRAQLVVEASRSRLSRGQRPGSKGVAVGFWEDCREGAAAAGLLKASEQAYHRHEAG